MTSKMLNLVQLEKTVIEANKFTRKYRNRFTEIRKFICGFAILLVYQIQDNEFESSLREGSDQNGRVSQE